MKYSTFIATTSALLALMALIGINIWQSTFTPKETTTPILTTKTLDIPRQDLGGSRKSSRPAFSLTVIVKSPVQNLVGDIVKK